MKTWICSLVATLFCLINLSAQEPAKYGFELREHLSNTNPNAMVPLLVDGKPEIIIDLIERYGGNIRLQHQNLFSLEIPAKHVKEFSLSHSLKTIQFSNVPGQALSDTMLINTNVDSIISNPQIFRNNYTGKGVVLGVIDSGIELAHPDFQDSLGRTRIMYVWDQKQPFDPNRQALNYNYGVEWDSTDINAGISTHDDRAAEFGHGSNVTGAAASNGLASGQFRGVAPEVNIIAVATDFQKPNWLQTVAESVDYIFKKADAMGMPCVINASVGTYIGSHDGKDIAARIIDALIKQKNGRAFVCAAGNAGNINFHVRQELNNDTAFTWFIDEPSQFAGFGGVYFEVWSDTADFNQLTFSIGADSEQNNNFMFRGRSNFSPIHNRLNVIYNDSIVGSSGNVLARIQTYAEESQGRYKLEVAIIDPDTANLLYRFETTGVGKVDIYSSLQLFRHNDFKSTNLPSVSQFPPIRNYVLPDSLQNMVSSFTCLPSVITVGNYTNRATYTDVSGTFRRISVTPGLISSSSSSGPNRNNYLKPDISSAGDYMFGTGRLATIASAISSQPSKVSSDSLHWRNGGTSMASPTVAGMVALYLQMCPKASNTQIKNDLLLSAKKDSFTTSQNNFSYGNGKANAFQFLQKQLFHPIFSFPLPNLCVGDSMVLALNPSFVSYSWNIGDTNSSITTKQTGKYFAIVENQNGCLAHSDTANLVFDSLPNQPTISQNGATLSINQIGTYQWFFNNNQINGATNSSLVATSSGNYYCQLTENSGCSINSDTLNVLVTSIEEQNQKVIKLSPNPTSGSILVTLNRNFQNFKVDIFNSNGKSIFNQEIKNQTQQFTVDMSLFDAGIYFLNIRSKSGVIYEKIIVQ